DTPAWRNGWYRNFLIVTTFSTSSLAPSESLPEEIRERQIDPVLLEQAIEHSKRALIDKRHADGDLWAELQGDSILESEYILLKFILGQENDPDLPLIANYLRSLQLPDGGWNMYPGGANDLNGTVKAYFALKLMGDDPEAPHMRVARDVVLAL